jgi:hypothetical protein
MAGFLDEAAFWERFLSDEELEALWHGGYGISYPFCTIDGPISISGGWPLYIGASVSDSGGFPLWMSGIPAISSNQFSLFTSAVGQNASGVSLHIGGVIPGTSVRGMNLWVGGEAHSANSYLPLFLANVGISGIVPLFIRGSGTAEGYVFADRSMSLFIQRPISQMATLYLHGPGNETLLTNTLYIRGYEPVVNEMTCSIPSAIGYFPKNSPLFIRGY